jgi:hypothetical protein
MVLALATAGYADIITLKNGRVINGTYLGGSPRDLKVQVGDSIETYDVSQVAKIEFGDGSSAPKSSPDRPVLRRQGGGSGSSNADDDRPTLRRDPQSTVADDNRPTLRRDPSPTSTASSSDDDSMPTLRRTSSSAGGDGPTILRPNSGSSSASTAASVSRRAPLEIPAGTNLVVRMIDGVDSDRDSVGKTFAASIDESITVAGETVIPRGADVVVKLVDNKEAGKLTGRAELTLSLVSVKFDGRMIDVNTQSITKESDARGKSTAKKAGAGAVAGAVLGGILGGGKGAAVGAAAGGAAGTGVEAMSSGPHVKVPSETRLTFVLDNPITI